MRKRPQPKVGASNRNSQLPRTDHQGVLEVGDWKLGVNGNVQRCYARAAFDLTTRPTISLNSSAVSRSFFSNDFAFTASSSAMRSSSVILMPVFSAHSSIDGGPEFLPRTMFTGFWPTSSGRNGTYSSGCSARHRRTQPPNRPIVGDKLYEVESG